MTMMFAMPASAAVKTSVKVLNVGKSYTISSTSKVTSSKKSVATAKKKSGSKYKITAKKKGVSTLKVYNKKGKQTKKVYLIATNGSSFKYSTSTVNLAKGGTKTVKGTSNISGMTVKYSSSNSNVATVNSSGKITAKKAGSATISAKFYYKGIKAKTVKKKVNVYTSSYNTDSITLTAGNTKTVSASVSSNCTAKYSSSDSSVAKVNSAGKITAVKKGTATITCKVYLGSTNVKTYSKKITVNVASNSSSSSSSSSSGSSGSSSGSSSSSSGSGSSSSTSTFTNHVSPGSDTISGGGKSVIEVCCGKESDVVTFTTRGDCAELSGVTTGTLTCSYNDRQTGYYTCLSYIGRKAGKCYVDVYVNGSLLRTVTITVTSDDSDYYTYTEWKQKLEEELDWFNSDSFTEKFNRLYKYIHTNYYYSTEAGYYCWALNAQSGDAPWRGGSCIAQAGLVIDMASDLGYDGEYHLHNGTWNGHVTAYIYVDGVCYDYDLYLA